MKAIFLVFLLCTMINGRRLSFKSRFISLPALYKVNSGEDAHFVLSQDLGVFDGVGGWTEEGVDSGIYSRTIAKYVSSMLSVERADSKGEVDVVSALNFASEECRRMNITGSCTACIASIDIESSLLNIYNLGDSSMLVLRNNQGIYSLIYKTVSSYHDFNTPYQIGHQVIADAKGQLTSLSFDSPFMGSKSVIPLQEEDVVILGTDGLFDNVYDEELVDVVNKISIDRLHNANELNADKNAFLEVIAENLMELARINAEDSSRPTPWSDALNDQKKREQLPNEGNFVQKLWNLVTNSDVMLANKLKDYDEEEKEAADGSEELGGKQDDITIIVSLISSDMG